MPSSIITTCSLLSYLFSSSWPFITIFHLSLNSWFIFLSQSDGVAVRPFLWRHCSPSSSLSLMNQYEDFSSSTTWSGSMPDYPWPWHCGQDKLVALGRCVGGVWEVCGRCTAILQLFSLASAWLSGDGGRFGNKFPKKQAEMVTVVECSSCTCCMSEYTWVF